jgi:signal transduction histidine kinase
MLTVVSRQTRRLARLVDELLAVSRIVSGRLHLEPEELDLGEVVRDVAAGMQQNLSRAGCPLFVAAPELVSGRWDRLRLEQLVTNLLSNAAKFGAGKPIEIAVGRTTSNATLIVRDHGIGIPADRVRAIFERFERAVSARAYGGLGLGLYIARSIVEAHGGTICADTAPGGGARFTVALPFAVPATLKAA